MSRTLKESKGRCDNDVLKPTCLMQSDDAENRSAKSRGTPKCLGAFKCKPALDGGSQGNKENKLDERRVLLAITVEIEDGCVEHIEMKEGDSAEAVAIKFCQDHNLPDQFVALLTEHIVSNIISISKEDKDIVFCSNDECASYDETWPRKDVPTSQGRHDSRCEQQSSGSCDCNNRAAKSRFAASEKENNYFQKGRKSPTLAKPKSNVLQKKVSDSLIAPTVTSLAKSGNLAPEKEKSKPYAPKPSPEQAKAVYMRLYTEFTRHKKKQEEDKKRSYERYQEKIDKNKINVSKKSWRIMLMRGKTAKQYRNYGELLYTEGLTKRENQQKLVEKKKKEDEAKELSELTGIPEISKRAKNLQREHGKVWKRLNQIEEKPKQDQLQELRNEVWDAQFMECTFKPQINHRIDNSFERNDGCNRFEQLFLDAESRRRRQAEYMQWFPEGVTFRPAINRGQVEGMDTPGEICSVQQEGTVFERLLQYASKLTKKKQMQEHLVHRPVDPATGRRFFKPLTGRKPQTDRNPIRLPIGEYLYKLKFAFDNKKEVLAAKDNKIKKEQASCQYVGATSQRLLGRLEEKGFKKVFECLDEDKDGKVVLATANYDQLSADVVQDIMEVIKDQECAEKPFTCSQFVQLMLGAEKKCHRATIHSVLKHKPHFDNSNSNYQFKMDRLSRNLAGRRRKFTTSRQWYKIICTDKERKQRRVEELRKEKQDQEMAECTFRPQTITRSSKKGSHLKVGTTSFSENSSAVEKAQQEVHGFYFQDERGPEWLGLPADGPACNALSRSADRHCSREVSRENVTVQVTCSDERSEPMGILDSLKVMVSESLANQRTGRGCAQKLADRHNNKGRISGRVFAEHATEDFVSRFC
ncbi:uncharacterized protein [Physcomitrium patens]|uniref:uncharacterized protein isoform X2 n=1 Tax=Physcomitrium patens TaxID=3218 RepID=UPI000D1595D4|nr:uncharacterized protein LOC112278377 isoform X2 [Physcomitrium patens]XP_024367521.1 uncharacterized protein LOC112278377 isoform X2 [Physcomitrium patens]|eukprot:XP_024367520.1 uncharacterized protein LOC112278377 isoform X2 [Physcomitrella patens]